MLGLQPQWAEFGAREIQLGDVQTHQQLPADLIDLVVEGVAGGVHDI